MFGCPAIQNRKPIARPCAFPHSSEAPGNCLPNRVQCFFAYHAFGQCKISNSWLSQTEMRSGFACWPPEGNLSQCEVLHHHAKRKPKGRNSWHLWSFSWLRHVWNMMVWCCFTTFSAKGGGSMFSSVLACFAGLFKAPAAGLLRGDWAAMLGWTVTLSFVSWKPNPCKPVFMNKVILPDMAFQPSKPSKQAKVDQQPSTARK